MQIYYIKGLKKVNKATIEIKGVSQDFILNAKEFRTGSKGFHGFGKLAINDKEKYQVNILCTLIGSKPKEDK